MLVTWLVLKEGLEYKMQQLEKVRIMQRRESNKRDEL